MPRNYKQEQRAHKDPAYRKADRARKRARRAAVKKGQVKPNDGKELDHKNFRTGTGPYRVVPRSENRKRQPATKKRGKFRKS